MALSKNTPLSNLILKESDPFTLDDSEILKACVCIASIK